MARGLTNNCGGLNSIGNSNSFQAIDGNSMTSIDLSLYDVEFTAQTIVTMLMTLNITMLAIVSDKTADPLVNTLLLKLNEPSIRVMTYSADDINTEATMESYASMIKLRMEETFSMVLCGDPNNTFRVFRSDQAIEEGISGADKLSSALDKIMQSGIEHNTRWLTLSPSRYYLNELTDEIARLDNVVVIVPIEWDPQTHKCPALGVFTMQIERSHRHLEEIGLTTEDCELLLNGTIYPNFGRGFNGRHLIIGLYVWDPFTMRINKSGTITYEGFCVDLIEELSIRLNFRYTLTEPADNNWGSPLPDGNWTGVVGMLQRYEIDISAAALITTEERETVMDATFPYYYDHVAVLYKRLDPIDNLWKTYFHPFKKEVFMCIGASVIFSCTLYLMFSLLSPSKRGIDCRRRVSCLEGLSHVASEIDNVVSAVFQQGRPDSPSHGSGQVYLAFWWLFLMIMAAIYKGNLIAFLMVPPEDVPFTTLYELATQSVYRWGVTGSTVVEYLFQISQRPDFKLMGEGIERFKADDKDINSLDPLIHLAKVKAGGYAYISDMVPMEIWMSEDCDLRLLEQTVIPLPFVLGLHNNSGFLSLFNKQLLDIDQMGLYNVWKQRWWPQMGLCGQDSRTAKKVLSIVETQASFYMLCLGIILSIMCLLFEFFMKTKLFAGISSSFYSFSVTMKNLFMCCRR